jgi:hypothetical protein
MRGRFGFFALGSALVVLAAGCGGGGNSTGPLTKAEYLQQMQSIAKELSTSVGGLGAATDAKSAASALSKVQKDVRSAVKKLEAISPPPQVNAPHKALTQAAADFADQLSPIIIRLQDGDLSALSAVVTLKSFKALQSASDELKRSGFDISGGAGS